MARIEREPEGGRQKRLGAEGHEREGRRETKVESRRERVGGNATRACPGGDERRREEERGIESGVNDNDGGWQGMANPGKSNERRRAKTRESQVCWYNPRWAFEGSRGW